jgi:hypothetical protein
VIRSVIGFVLLHAALCGTGLTAMRALGLLRPRPGALGLLVAGPVGLLLGIVLVVPAVIVLLVCGVPLTLPTVAIAAAAYVAASFMIQIRSEPAASAGWWPRLTSSRPARVTALVVGILLLLYVAGGLFAFSRLGTVWDDARIWSLRGLTLTYHHSLVPTIFEVQSQAGGHPVYPLLQPAFEAILSQAMGAPQLRWMHSELWLIFCSGVWTAVYLIARRSRGTVSEPPYWIAVLLLTALTPAVLVNVHLGDADVTGALLLSLGTVSLGLWLDGGSPGDVLLGGMFLAAAASTKDEDAIAAGLVLALTVVLHVSRELRADRERLWALAAAIGYVAIVVAPWRIWTAVHHLTDSIEPPLPKALNPTYIAHRTTELHLTASAMFTQVTHEWGAVLLIFVLVSAVSLISGRSGWSTRFYLASFVLTVIAMLWLYTTTNVSLAFLLPTSMNRTVDVFMIVAGFTAADQVARLGHPGQKPSRPPLRSRA